MWFIISFLNRDEGKIIIVDEKPEKIKENLIETLKFREENIFILKGKLRDKIQELSQKLEN